MVLKSKKSLLWILPLSFFSLIVVAVLIFMGVKQWRAQQMVEESQTLLEGSPSQADVDRAIQLARSATYLDSDNVAVARNLAELVDRINPKQAWNFWKEVNSLEDATRSDRTRYFRSLLNASKMNEAESFYNRYNEILSTNPDFVMESARLFTAQGNLEKGIDSLKSLLDTENGQIELKHHLFFVQLTQLARDPELRSQGIDHLRNLAKGDNELALPAVRNLAKFPGLDQEETQFVINRLEDLAPGREDQLLRLELEFKSGVKDHQTVAREARTLFDLDSADERKALAHWYNKMKFYEETLVIMPPRTARTRQDFFLLRADALAYLEKWDRLNDEIENTRVPLPDYIANLFQMRSLFEMGESRKATLEWSRALLDASDEIGRLRFLSAYTKKLGLIEYQKEVLRKIIEIPRFAKDGYVEYMKILESEGDTRGVREMLEQMRETFPVDLEVLNDLTYYNLLLNNEVEESLEEARYLVEQNPDQLAPYMTLALALLKNENPSEALEVFQKLNVNWDKIPSRWRTVIVAVLCANGEKDWADRYAQNLSNFRLLPEESKLIEESCGDL